MICPDGALVSAEIYIFTDGEWKALSEQLRESLRLTDCEK